ncbi:homoserine O-succinyltransferase [Parashewanella spongiae]|uniref:Homoserine O-succinyltransferase n=1 Tax=Parashewanella spongiae TaxID=342950 RepID=A0A3A6TC60_9GAMM|nr:homoserine O-succinyltransferase [Parashewanella spongiae]MCL1079342.1 homoserine O-succinyltransferase [Parashewanella spongiae]RJY05084.1 homoserine O-succinyltransferase [Parashewanella spongiae]
MPVRIPDNLPAGKILNAENIFVMPDSRALHQDIRPIRVLVLNLMPNKIETETQLLRMLGNTPLQIEIDLMRIHEKQSKHTSVDHMATFYCDFEQINHRNYDGMIVTGAPLGQINFEEVSYWTRICEIIDWSQQHVTSTLFLCWAAHAAFYHLYGLKRQLLKRKRVGVFKHVCCKQHVPLLRGFDDQFTAPHSRFSEIDIEKIVSHPDLELLAVSDEAGAYITLSKDMKNLLITGHPEYDRETLAQEYERDLQQNLPVEKPVNYFPDENPQCTPITNWRSHGNLLISNWLNYYVYQETPYKLEKV